MAAHRAFYHWGFMHVAAGSGATGQQKNRHQHSEQDFKAFHNHISLPRFCAAGKKFPVCPMGKQASYFLLL
jgi:hypothetical protein